MAVADSLRGRPRPCPCSSTNMSARRPSNNTVTCSITAPSPSNGSTTACNAASDGSAGNTTSRTSGPPVGEPGRYKNTRITHHPSHTCQTEHPSPQPTHPPTPARPHPTPQPDATTPPETSAALCRNRPPPNSPP